VDLIRHAAEEYGAWLESAGHTRGEPERGIGRKLLGIKGRFICDMGAYLQLLTPAIPGFSALMMTGCYRMPALSFEQIMVFTNKMATDAYRGAGHSEACYLAERTMDLVAGELGLDPAEVRRKNFIPKDAFPATTSGGLVYDSGDYEQALDKALAMVDYKNLLRKGNPTRRNSQKSRLISRH